MFENTKAQEEAEKRWSEWLLARNRRGAKFVLILDLILYPMFALLDLMVGPREWLWLLWSSRIAVTVFTIVLLCMLNTSVFRKYWTWLTGLHIAASGIGIVLMVAVMGGAESPYYAGINLVIVGAGLLYVWPRWTILTAQGAIVTSYLAVGIASGGFVESLVPISNMFFLVSTAIIVCASQILGYRTQRDQVMTQLALEQTKVTLENAHNQLKKLDRFKSQFFANITHELKTPLAMILSPLELMLSGDMGRFGSEQTASIRSMLHNGMKLLKLIQDLLDMSKLEESHIRLRIANSDLVAYLRDLVAQVEPLARRKAITLTFSSRVEQSMVWCDLDRLERVFVNLLSNASKFTPENGLIRVELQDQGKDVLISVKDNGPGFPAEMAERIFERFVQVDMEGTRKFGGAGIGLALAKELVVLHGGRIWAESRPGDGACFKVVLVKDREHFRPDTLERRERKAEASSERRRSDRGISDWSGQLISSRDDFRFLDIADATERRIVERDLDEDLRPYKVLVVEDTPDIIRLVHMSLRQQFKVMAADDGLKGLDLAVREMPNLIITDLMMPGIDGYELTRRLRADPKMRHIPILMLTARGDLEDRVAGLESGVNAYMVKPFSPKELLSTVRGLLNIQETTADLLLSQKMDSLEQVASGLAHEINNPLNYIKNALDVARTDLNRMQGMMTQQPETFLPAEQVDPWKHMAARVCRMFDTAEAGILRIGGTVNLMRKYSREGYSRTLIPYDIFQAAREVVGVVLPATGRDVHVSVEAEEEGFVECIPEEINQVVTNLVQNAIEAAPEGQGRVLVKGQVMDHQVLLQVIDNGPGIPAELRQHIFTPFYSTKGPNRGMGLGLTIVWRVVQSLGGTIDLKSDVGQGTEFKVTLPRSNSKL